MWWVLLIPLAASDTAYNSLYSINSVYKTTVSGGSRDLYSLKLTAYDEALEVNGIFHQQVLLLQNELDHSLALHVIRCWEDLSGLEYEQHNHTTPALTTDNSTEALEIIQTAAASMLNNSGLVSSVFKQIVHVTTMSQYSASELLEFKLYNADVVVGDDVYRLSVFMNNTAEITSAFASHVDRPTYQTQTTGVSTKTLGFGMAMTSLLTAVATYLALYSYFKKHGSFPLAKGGEVRHVPFTLP
jgi:hypothetical protein